ncbi:MAG: acyl carrier protein [Alphaproteobacteria bacterium]|nr:acyl carrier protein [Alphaproteobacteria bacterium]
MDALELEIKDLIVEALMLDDAPTGLEPDTDLFATLGLDSVDALELAMAVRRKYGIEFAADDDQNKAVFTSIRNLATFVRTHAQA